MSERISDLARRLVVGHKRDGRCIYDAQAKRELVLACRESGVSMSKLARDCGVNANQLSSWVRRHERETDGALPSSGNVVEVEAPAFVPVHIDAAAQQNATVVGIQACLPNGVVVDLTGCGLQQACELIETLGRLRCSGLTKC